VTAIPLVDLAAQHREVAGEIESGLAEVLAAGDYIGGRAVGEFESAYAAHLGVGHCIGVGNGTDAVELALRALGLGPGDDVVLPANTFVATAEAVVRAGCRPVFADVDDDALLIDPDGVEPALTARTRAVLPVHLYGQCAPVELFAGALADRGIAVVEDAAQAQGARRHGLPAGGLGVIAGTSFYPGKNLGAYGDAGAVLTDDPALARTVRLLGAHGSLVKYRHESLGFNSRLDTVQAVVLRAKLRRLATWNERRRLAAGRYDELLKGIDGVRRPVVLPGNESVWHLYVIRVPARDDVLARLNAAGVAAGIHYPVPVHLHPAFEGFGSGRGSLPVSERSAGEILSLPIYPGITEDQQDRVVVALVAALP